MRNRRNVEHENIPEQSEMMGLEVSKANPNVDSWCEICMRAIEAAIADNTDAK